MDLKLYTYKARLSRVIDGDTVELNVDLGMSVSVKETFRLYGINAPEISKVKHDSEEYKKGMQTKARLESLVQPVNSNEYLIIETFKDSKEKYGRYLARIYRAASFDLNGVVWECVNDILVNEGLAVSYVTNK